MKRVFRYATGQEIPEGAVYLSTIANGIIPEAGEQRPVDYKYVWHYFLVEIL